jgi:hypothetical protein
MSLSNSTAVIKRNDVDGCWRLSATTSGLAFAILCLSYRSMSAVIGVIFIEMTHFEIIGWSTVVEISFLFFAERET